MIQSNQHFIHMFYSSKLTRLCFLAPFVTVVTIPLLVGAQQTMDPEKFWIRNQFGSEVQFSEIPDSNTDAILLVALDRYCPIANANLKKISAFYKASNRVRKDRTGTPVVIKEQGTESPSTYVGDRLKVIGIYTERDLGLRSMGAHVMDFSIPFPVFQDPDQKLIRALGISRLSEVAVLDRDFQLVYRGPFDDQFVRGRSLAKPKKHWARKVVNQLLDGHELEFKAIKPEGCLITRPTKRRYPRKTFYEDVYPIIQSKCQTCHRSGAIGPMPFETVEDVIDYAEMIDEVITDERMPPFPAVSPKKFSHEMDQYNLSEKQKSTLTAWLRGDNVNELGDDGPDGKIDFLLGDESAVEERSWEDPNDWRIGEPHFVFEMQEPITVPATGVIDYVYFPVKIPPEVYDKYGDKNGDLWIQAIETKAGEVRVVHHIQVLEHPFEINEKSRWMSPVELLFAYGPSVDGAKLLGGYTPGNQDNAKVYPDKMGMKISAGSNLLFELHYTPYGREAKDRSKVGIRFRKTKPQKEMETFFYFRKRGDFRIPARMSNHSMQDVYHFGPKPVAIHGMRFHQHLRGKSVRYEIVDLRELRKAGGGNIQRLIENVELHDLPRGERLLSIPVWDFNWQLTYSFEETLIIHPHQAILATAYWDNSKLNRVNPDCDADVPWGQQTIHEMFNTLFQYEKLSPDDHRLKQEPKKSEGITP